MKTTVLLIILSFCNLVRTQTNLADIKCPPVEDGDNLTQSEFTTRLTHDCRYDRLLRPGKNNPLTVLTQIYIYHLEASASHELQFKTHMLMQVRFKDERLAYKHLSPKRPMIMGETILRNKIWTPHMYLANEKESSLMGSETKDVLVSISPEGEVIFSARLKASLYCWMNLQKFPFDDQHCSIVFESWTYNTSEVKLTWEENYPVTLSKQLHLTEFTLQEHWTNATEVQASNKNQLHGAFIGNYSRISFSFHLQREIGFYLMDYFLPSIMIVSTSWVTFWLSAEASAPRITLGCSTMLSFITLASSQQKTLPRVSYIKASEIWFLGCTFFIFGTLVEFAFVNTIWRMKQKNIELKKVNSKYILKSTLTPKLHRKEMQKFSSMNNLQKSHSMSSLHEQAANTSTPYNHYLTVNSLPSINRLPTITTQSVDDLLPNESMSISVDPVTNKNNHNHNPFHGWTSMTPQEISQWIDNRSKILFPVAFFVFNVCYFGFVSLF